MVLILTTLLSCIKPVELSKAQSTVDLPTISMLDATGQRESYPLPEQLQSAIAAELSGRNFNVISQQIPDSFQRQRSHSQRLASIDQYPTLLIETEAQFYSQLNGRFRWEVHLSLTLLQAENEQLFRQTTIPIFHQFHHEREEEALLAAQTIILREINILIDDYLLGVGP